MLLLFIAYVGGVLTILSPCILAVLPFVFARADRPFRSHGLPMLLGMAVAFAAVATLAAVGGGWVIALSQYGRYVALAVFALFGLTLLSPKIADRLTRPLVALGARLTDPRADRALPRRAMFSPALLGVGTGLLWAPCAGPILGLILTGAAINGASVGTSLLLLAYAAGAATSLATALLFGGRFASVMKRSVPFGEDLRRAGGAAVLVAVAAIALGLDTGLLARLSIGTTSAFEQVLVDKVGTAWTAKSTRPEGALALDPGGMLKVAAVQAWTSPPLEVEGRLPSLSGAIEWINSAPLSPEGLRGKVVLIDFWTYSCINCLRTLPYVRAWAAKYKEAGLVVIGVHTPEFAFEKLSANVHKATRDLGIEFPVAVDSDFAMWRAFGNLYWPAFYFVDAQGRIRHHHFGEGSYDGSEVVIQRLLAEAGSQVPPGLVSAQGQGTQAAPGPSSPQSQERYLGYQQAQGFASPGGVVRDRSHAYRSPWRLPPNEWSLAGEWSVGRESAASTRANGRIALRFTARDLHLVLGSAPDSKPLRFRIFVDGKPPLSDHGSDVDDQGNGTIDGQRLYQLVRQAKQGPSRLFEIEFLDAGAHAFVFTFG